MIAAAVIFIAVLLALVFWDTTVALIQIAFGLACLALGVGAVALFIAFVVTS